MFPPPNIALLRPLKLPLSACAGLPCGRRMGVVNAALFTGNNLVRLWVRSRNLVPAMLTPQGSRLTRE